MFLIVCLDDNNGMMFNHRRQSRDGEVIKDILSFTNGHRILMNGYSRRLFDLYKEEIDESENLSRSFKASEDKKQVLETLLVTHEEFLTQAGEDDFCFVENESISPYLPRIQGFLIYRWNRVYPYDQTFPASLLENFRIESTKEFVGSSHDKITREFYQRK